MTDLQVFTFEPTGDQIQTVLRDGVPWMVATPIARALAYRDANDMTRNLDEDEKGTHTVRTLGGEQRVIIISESGELVLDPPQVRVKPKGMAEIHRKLGGSKPLAVQQQMEIGS